jgi:hypothetical protein
MGYNKDIEKYNSQIDRENRKQKSIERKTKIWMCIGLEFLCMLFAFGILYDVGDIKLCLAVVLLYMARGADKAYEDLKKKGQ